MFFAYPNSIKKPQFRPCSKCKKNYTINFSHFVTYIIIAKSLLKILKPHYIRCTSLDKYFFGVWSCKWKLLSCKLKIWVASWKWKLQVKNVSCKLQLKLWVTQVGLQVTEVNLTFVTCNLINCNSTFITCNSHN